MQFEFSTAAPFGGDANRQSDAEGGDANTIRTRTLQWPMAVPRVAFVSSLCGVKFHQFDVQSS